MTLIELGEVVREARRNAGLTQEQMAARVGCSPRTIIRIESGNTDDFRVRLLLDVMTVLSLDMRIETVKPLARPVFVVAPGAGADDEAEGPVP